MTVTMRSLVIVACIGALLSTQRPILAVQPPILRVGASLSLSGPYAAVGEAEGSALHLAQDEINAHGGIAGRQMIIDVQDDEGRPEIAAQLATQMISNGDAAIFTGAAGPTAAVTPETQRCTGGNGHGSTAIHRLTVAHWPALVRWKSPFVRRISPIVAHSRSLALFQLGKWSTMREHRV